jgi:hypothetical protein
VDPSASPLVGAIAVRPYTVRIDDEHKQRHKARHRKKPPKWPDHVLVFDTETTIDAAQALLFGSYQLRQWRDGPFICLEEGLFYADELPDEDPDAFSRLGQYARVHSMRLRSRDDFVRNVFYPSACELGSIVTGFNLPFDVSRIAVEWGEARRRFYGGFSFPLVDYLDKAGNRQTDPYYARVCIKPIDGKRAMMGFAGGREPTKGKHVQARFLDLRTLAFALTNRSHSLASACQTFGVEHGKMNAEEHGRITDDYIDYNRRDVLASCELLERLRQEFDTHPIDVDPCETYSPASIAKGYLRTFGVQLPAKQFDGVSREVLGNAMCGYYGGRAEARIRRTPVPVMYLDFLSMYPTVNALLELWSMLTAERLEIVDATSEVQELLERVTSDAVFTPAYWKQLAFFAEVEPASDILPVRAQYASDVRGWNIGSNFLTSAMPLYYAGPDLVASALLTGKAPRITRAFRVVPHGRQALRTVRLANEIPIDPLHSDFFRELPERRTEIRNRGDLSAAEQGRLREFIKVLANAGSYGIFAEVQSRDVRKDRPAHLAVHGNSIRFDVQAPFAEVAGAFCFPPIAALNTAAARLMLALLERCVTDAGGQYALCDTDSMAIVATKTGGLVSCGNGSLQKADGTLAIRALSWIDVNGIVERFAQLSPYDRQVIRGSILKIEDVNYVNYDPIQGQRQLYAFAISTKRYALYWLNHNGMPVVENDPSEHGLGHLLNPIDPKRTDTRWIWAVWTSLISKAHGFKAPHLSWLDRPAISRVTVSSPTMLRYLGDRHTPYRKRVKPFGFALSAHVAPLGHPPDVDPERFHLVAPYERNPSRWLSLEWIDVYSGDRFNITTDGPSTVGAVAVKSYRDVVDDYATHPESKSAESNGRPCDRTTVGLLARRRIRATAIEYVGKESRKIDEVSSGLAHDANAVLLHFHDGGAEWRLILRPRLLAMPRAAAAVKLGITERAVSNLRTGKARPNRKVREALRRLVDDETKRSE